MKTRSILRAAGALVVAGSLMLTQAAPKQPTLKSKKEQDGYMAIVNAPDANARMAAIDDFLAKFADTELKPVVLVIAAETAQSQNNFEKMMIYAERALEADPESYQSMLLISRGIAARTREFDLDKEEKLSKADKYANSALPLIAKAEKPNPQVTDEQWTGAKKDYASTAHEALGLSAMVRKKYDVAVTELKAAVDGAATPDQSTMVRLASAYNFAGKPDEAIATIDKLMAMPDLNPQVKQVATMEKDKATKLKSAGGKPSSAPAPSQVEVKKP
jgi:tetratricopeptide (TPR) repeat protein